MKLIAASLILLFLTSCHFRKDVSIDGNKIVGRWQLVGAQGSITDFTKTQELNYVNGGLMASFTYTIDEDAILTAVDKSNANTYRWRIMKLTEDSLVMKWMERDYENRYFRVRSTISN